MRLTKLWTVLSAVLGVLMAVFLIGTDLALANYGHINQFLGVTDTVYEQQEGSTQTDTEYFKSRYGEISDANLEKLIADTYKQVINEAREGSVLLWNNRALPLEEGERSVTLFGYASAHPVYVGGGAASTIYNDAEITVDLRDALVAQGFSINETVYNALSTASASASTPGHGLSFTDWEATQGVTPTFAEVDASIYDSTSWENDYNDAAIVTLSRYGGEGSDIYAELFADEDGTMIHQLQLTKKEKDMLQMIKDSGKFGKVIVLINCPWQMELEELKTYGVDAALYIAYPGVTGFHGIAEILTGETNPSGRLVDTYAVDALSAPATVNSVGNTPAYTNAAEIKEQIWFEESNNPYPGSFGGASAVQAVSVQQENIYIGYKYYETRYEDVILDRFNASGANGIFASTGNTWNYADEVSYPFGYGMSYTTFEQEIVGVDYDADTDKYTVRVQVTNTGEVAGKYAVPVYVQTPYGAYEMEYGVEKSAVNLVGFGKTGMLEANGGTETVEVEVDRYLLASYDSEGAQGYIISEGDNYFAVGTDAHDALNNILAAKGATGMIDHEGNPVAGDAGCVYHFTTEFDDLSYRFSETGYRVTNQFADNDINYWMDDAHQVTYLTRSDWNGTFPTQPAQVTATQEMIDVLDSYTTEDSLYFKNMQPETVPEVGLFTQSTEGNRIDNGLTFVDMRNFDYDDTVNWNLFLDQLTIEEMASLFADQSGGLGITAVGLPATSVADGIIGPNGSYQYGDGRPECLYTGQNILGATFNRELMVERSRLIGEESLYTGRSDNWGLGLDLHRTPFSGRNWEYVSEDANLTSLVGYLLTGPLQERGLIASPKHFCGNDQESYRIGVSTFYTEQSFREGSLRGFEGSLRFGDAHGTMASMSRQGLVYTCSSYALMTQVLRNEWGFQGRVVSDASRFAYMQEYNAQVAAGTDQFCYTPDIDFTAGTNRAGNQIIATINSGDGNMLQLLRESAKHSIFALSRSNIVNGLTANTVVRQVMPWWEQAIYAVDIVCGVLLAGSVVMLTLSMFVFKKKQED